jgi:hypothetical protein
MGEDRTSAGDDDSTQSWLTGALAGVHHLSAEDLRAMADLRHGTAMLVGVGGPVVGARILLWRPEVRVGRRDDCLVWLSPANVSRHHATSSGAKRATSLWMQDP